MPIPLGILAAAGVRPAGAAGAYEHIQTIAPTGSQSTIVFTNLSSWASTYEHLQLRFTIRSQRSATIDQLVLRLTASAGNHAAHVLLGNGSSVTSLNDPNSSHMYVGEYPAANYTASAFMAGVTDLLDAYSTTKNKTLRTLSGMAGTSNSVQLSSGLFYGSTAAVNEIYLVSATGSNFTSTSRFSIYGLKASA